MGKWAETEEAYFGGSDAKEEKGTMKGRVLPILFNTDMVQAILDGRKTVTRRCVKLTRKDSIGFYVLFREEDDAFVGVTEVDENDNEAYQTPPYQKEDILYVRETWAQIKDIPFWQEYFCGDTRDHPIFPDEYIYKADNIKVDGILPDIKWYPSIHMPKQAARIWLKVTDVRVERLQDIDGQAILLEGVNCHVHPEAHYFDGNQKMMFAELWDSTIKKSVMDRYGWDANPWVWVIEFERCEKPVREE